MSLDKLDFNRISTGDFSKEITPEKREAIKKEAKEERKFIFYRETVGYLFQRADEIAYRSTKHAGKTAAEKALLAANIAIDDDKSFIERLESCKFTTENLKRYITLLTVYKQEIAKEAEGKADDATKKRIAIIKKPLEEYTDVLTSRLQKYYGVVNPSIIINKIEEIITYADITKKEAIKSTSSMQVHTR